MNTQPTNPDLPFERQMLHILRSYQRLQDEVLRLRTENSRLNSTISHRAVSDQRLHDRDNRICHQQRHIDQLNAHIQNLRRKYHNVQSAYWTLRRKVKTIESIPDDLYITPEETAYVPEETVPGTVSEEAADRPITIAVPDIDLTLECPPPTFDTPSAQ